MSDFSFQEEPRRGQFQVGGKPSGLTGMVMDILKTDDEAFVQKILMGIACFFVLATFFVILW